MYSILGVIGLIVTSTLAQADGINPGLWKISLESAVTESPDWKPEPFETTQCLSEADARNPAPLILGMSSPGATGCDFPTRDYSGNSFTFDVSCSGTLGIQGHGRMNYTATSLEGYIDLNVGTTERLAMQNRIRGTYLGNCIRSGDGS